MRWRDYRRRAVGEFGVRDLAYQLIRSRTLLNRTPENQHYRGSANTYTALAPLAVSASGVTTVCVAAIGPPPAVMAMN
jgi:hypothetical protein